MHSMRNALRPKLVTCSQTRVSIFPAVDVAKSQPYAEVSWDHVRDEVVRLMRDALSRAEIGIAMAMYADLIDNIPPEVQPPVQHVNQNNGSHFYNRV